MQNQFTEVHVPFAQNLKENLSAFCRLPSDSQAGRGAGKLMKTLESLKASNYDNLHVYDINKLATQAMPVDPSRMSLPDVAGVLDPADVLSEPFKSEFLDMPNSYSSN